MPDSDSEDELPPMWEERATLEGSVYYVNHVSKRTQWTHPRSGRKKKVSGDLPIGWAKMITDDGKVLFVDHVKQRTSYSDPRLAFAVEEKASSKFLRQKFDGSTTALQILHGQDLQGKVAVVTGANCGIGWETARSLALHGCHVIFGVRKLAETREAFKNIYNERPHAKCTAIMLDLESLTAVANFVTELKKLVSQVDILVLNAGIFGVPFELTVDGFEKMFQVNYLSQFYLTLRLKDMLLPDARVVIVSSESHRFSNLTSPVNRSELSPSTSCGFWSMQTYNNTKLCNILFAYELSNQMRSKLVSVYAVHPGNVVSSRLSRNWWFYRLLFTLVRPFTKSLQQAASTTIFCATHPELDMGAGIYFNNCWSCEPSALVQDRQMSHDLWDISIEMIKSWESCSFPEVSHEKTFPPADPSI